VDTAPVNIGKAYPAETLRLKALLWLTAIALGVGLASPIVTLNKFIFLENTFSVLGGVVQLLKEGKVFLFILITGFSILLPILKIGVLYRLLSKAGDESRTRKYLHWMHLYGKWSMLDVFVVAVLVVTVKLGAFANVEVRYGLYAFATAVVLTMYVTARVVALADRSETIGAEETSS
jgi:paraquat-inducible protein A